LYGTAAALVALLGIYSVLANDVARRHRELGVRMAVGARAADIVRLVLRDGARNLIAGVVVGAGLASVSTRLLAGLLHGVTPGDPVTLAVVAGGLIAGGLIACAVPARRAARIDPLGALKG